MPHGPPEKGGGPRPDAVEQALAAALTAATQAGEWTVVAQLASELQARREARAEVIDLASRRERGAR